jgi:hypothetical protein
VRLWSVSQMAMSGVLGCGLGSEAKLETLNTKGSDIDTAAPSVDTATEDVLGGDTAQPGLIDTGTDEPAPVPPCEVDISIAFPGGEVITPSFCGRVNLLTTMESAADGALEVRTPVLELYDTTSTYNECLLRLNLPSFCGDGYYRMHGEYGNNIALTARGCDGVPEDYALWFVSGWGYVRIDEATVDSSADPDGSGLHTMSFSGGMNVYAPLPPDPVGPAITGTFSVRAEVPMEVAGETECTLVDADEDGDGWVSDEFDGDDCYDHQPDTFPGAAEHDSESACMTDSDGDGFGSQLPGGVGVSPGTDCDDNDADRYPGASEVDGDGVDSDCNGED